MKLGVGISLGTLLNPTLLTWAAELRAAGVEHCCYANAPVDTIAVSAHDTPAQVEQLAALKTMGMSVGVRPRPMILEQVVLETTKTPNFIASNTSLRAVKLLQPELCPGGVVIQHEAADTSNWVIRGWAVRELRPHVGIIYYGRHGMVGPDGGPGYGYGADFGSSELPHIVYVALNAAGAGDASVAGQSPGPADCTAKDIRLAAERFDTRFEASTAAVTSAPIAKTTAASWTLQVAIPTQFQFKKYVHINVLESTPVPVMKDMIYAAAIGCAPDIIMLRSVFGKNDPRGAEGNTLTDPANPNRHWVTPRVLQAIKECAAWMT